MSKAKGNIEEALELLDDALNQRPGPKPSARAIRGYLDEARVAATKADSRSAVSALDEAILVLERGRSGDSRYITVAVTIQLDEDGDPTVLPVRTS